jgi:hypothetical protein
MKCGNSGKNCGKSGNQAFAGQVKRERAHLTAVAVPHPFPPPSMTRPTRDCSTPYVASEG